MENLNKNFFTCYLIGDDPLLLQCAEMLLQHGHKILGIISSLDDAHQFASHNHICHFDSLPCAQRTNSLLTFDYLFSIINSTILPQKIIQLANKMAINFHNAPLPQYAGVHALSWAILNNEQRHGVTWHIMTDIIDGGDILKQATFHIDPNETGLSLSLKCYEHALITFNELINELCNSTFTPVQQNFAERTYYDFTQKPKGNGWINWLDSACNIERTVRALDLGHSHYNRLATPKFKIGDKAFIINKLLITNELSIEPPGTIIKILKNAWYVTTQTSLLRLEKIYTLDGHFCDLDDLVRDFNLLPGSLLCSPTAKSLETYKKMSQESAKWEQFWVRQLIEFDYTKLPFQPQHMSLNKTEKMVLVAKLELFQSDILDSLSFLPHGAQSTDLLLTAVLVYLYRLEYKETIGVGFYEPIEQEINLEIMEFFAKLLPFSIAFNNEISFYDAMELVIRKRNLIKNKKFFEQDIFYRYPELLLSERRECPLAVIVGNDELLAQNIHHLKSSVVILIYPNKNEISWWTKGFYIDETQFFIKMIQNSIYHLKNLLASIPENYRSSILTPPLLTQKEHHELVKWSTVTTSYPANRSIHQIFEDQCLSTPDNVAIIYQKKSLSYKELNQKANQLAHYLQKNGLTPGTFGAICTSQEVHLIIGILAILKTGAAYIPIDPNYPKQHILFLLHDSKPKILLASKKLSEKLQYYNNTDGCFVLLLESIVCELEQESVKNLEKELVTPASLAYIIYTSGTTGKSKGVIVPHKAVLRLVKNTNFIKISSSDRIAQAASISFDAATFEIWGALLNGATLVAVPYTTLLNIDHFAEYIKRNKITILWLTSTIFNQYAAKNPRFFNQLTYLLVGGDVLNKELIMSIVNGEQGAPNYILNGYGPTENTTFTTTHLISKADANLPSVPIGTPIANTSVYILDANLQLVPIGATGELYTGGDGLAIGYLNNPELTQEKFVYVSNLSATLYKTGDMVRWMPDGKIEYLGRTDNQVKIRGFRVELEAIQACLLHHESISQCIVIVRANELGNNTKTLVAYIVCRKKTNDLELQAFLTKQLPTYMIPNFFVYLDKFPLTANGKVDHKKLPTVDLSKAARITKYIAPHTSREKSLVLLWRNLLGIHDIGIEDNFFDLGGHSLLITQLILQVQEIYQLDLPLHKFLEEPTIKQLCQLIESSYVKNNNVQHKQMKDDLRLSQDIYLKKLPNFSSPPKTIFLTGVTGFLGAHLLYDLYHATTAKIYCLIRSNYDHPPLSRLDVTLTQLQLSLSCSERIIPIGGDLSLPKLGLTDEQFSTLADEVDIIYHNGAAVHHLYNYNILRAANVLSTRNIINLATQKKRKIIHYISTLSAVGHHLDDNKRIVEDFIALKDLSLAPGDGYSQTKWVSEQFLATAFFSGVPVYIYRPGWIMGHSNSGAIFSENNHLLLLIKGCIQLRAAPAWDIMIDMLPVDFISHFITTISLTKKQTANVYNMVNTNTISWTDLINYLNNRGYSITLVKPAVWKKNYLNTIDKNNALYALYALYKNLDDFDWMKGLSSIYNACCDNATKALSSLQMKCPLVDYALLDIYFNYLERCEYLPKHLKNISIMSRCRTVKAKTLIP